MSITDSTPATMVNAALTPEQKAVVSAAMQAKYGTAVKNWTHDRFNMVWFLVAVTTLNVRVQMWDGDGWGTEGLVMPGYGDSPKHLVVDTGHAKVEVRCDSGEVRISKVTEQTKETEEAELATFVVTYWTGRTETVAADTIRDAALTIWSAEHLDSFSIDPVITGPDVLEVLTDTYDRLAIIRRTPSTETVASRIRATLDSHGLTASQVQVAAEQTGGGNEVLAVRFLGYVIAVHNDLELPTGDVTDQAVLYTTGQWDGDDGGYLLILSPEPQSIADVVVRFSQVQVSTVSLIGSLGEFVSYRVNVTYPNEATQTLTFQGMAGRTGEHVYMGDVRVSDPDRFGAFDASWVERFCATLTPSTDH